MLLCSDENQPDNDGWWDGDEDSECSRGNTHALESNDEEANSENHDEHDHDQDLIGKEYEQEQVAARVALQHHHQHLKTK